MNLVKTPRFMEAIAPLFEGQTVEPYFQSIVSIRRTSILGVEALSRIVDIAGHAAPPVDLLRRAAAAGLTYELDCVCLEAALRRFQKVHREFPQKIVFLNAHAGTLVGKANDGLVLFASLAEENGIDPRNIAIELLETAYEDIGRLQDAVSRSRAMGFLVALDDIGAGYSNLDRIAAIRPDLIKADRSLVQGICDDYYKQEVFRALVQVSEKIGGWIVAEGVETEEDAVCLLDLGGDLLQGYYFERPQPSDVAVSVRDRLVQERVDHIAQTFKRETVIRVRDSRLRREERHRIANEIVQNIRSVAAALREEALARAIKAYPDLIESASLLDEAGIQITETLTNSRPQLPEKTIIFKAPRRGHNHALKEYYYVPMEVGAPADEPFETKPYVPLPSGNLCITISTRFTAEDGSRNLLCLHVQE